MQRLRSTFKRSRTPTGNEMKSQSSLEVPKQVRSASFDEIQLEAQRQESSSSLSSSSATNAELRSIASIAMATSSSLAVSSALSSSSSATAAAASSSSSSSWSNQYNQGWGQQQQQPPPSPTMTSSGQTSQSPLPSWSEHFAQLHGAGASAAAAASASTGTLLRRSANTLRPPPGGGQRSKSFDVASVGEHRHHHGHGSHGQGPSLLDRSASTTSSIAIDRAGGGSSPSHTGYGYSRWKSSAERDNPPAQAYSCWHCACVDEYRASLQQQQQTHLTVGDSSASSWGDTDEPDNYSYDDDYYDNDADEECDSFSGGGGGGIGSSGELADFEPGPLQLERDASDNSYYFVVVRKAYEDSCLGSADDGSELGLEAGETSGGRREGSPEIRVTLTPSTSLPESEPGAGGCGFESEEAIGGAGGGAFDLGPATSSGGSSAASRQRRRSLSRQEALELPILLQVAAAESSGPGDSSPDEDEQQASPREISTTPTTTTTTTTTDQDDGGTPRGRAASAENPAAGLVVRDIFLTVPDLKRDRAASVDSCFNNNKNGKIETCYSLQVPQQSPRSKSVDIVLPTDVQTRYTALLPEDARFLGEKDDGGAGAGQRELRSTPDWSSTSLNGEHLWVPTAASGEFCYINDCSKHGARLKCSACRVVVHTACTSALNFACKPSFRDVGVRQYREQKVTQHHWVHRRSQKGKCTNCAKSFQSKLSFSSKEIVAVGCSWCKQAYHNRESCFNAERIGEECRLGLHSSIMVPPSWIVKLPKRGAFKSSLRKSPKKKRGPKSKDGPKGGEEEKEDPLKLWVVKPIPTSSVTPVLVFINPRSGGNQGAKLLQKFQWLLNPRQVFDLTQGGPKMGLELFKKVPNLRILACGGDGTVGWVLSVLDQIGANPAPAVGTLPLGTGNDLARALGWGGGYTDEPIGKILVSMAESEISILDRWQLLVERNPDASGQDEDAAKGKENLPLNVVNNYFSLGVDAHIALEFHEAREAHPERFNSRLRNKMFYGQMGGKDLVVRRWKDLSEYVTLECDGQDVTAKLKEHRVHAILFLNIDSYGGGTHPWGGGMGRPPTTEDGLIEVVGLTTYQLPLLQAGGHGTSIAQCSTAKLVTSKTIPMQVDGEACRLLPSIINMNLLNKATMLAKRRNQGKPRQKAAEVERLKLPLMKIRMHDYETFHSDKERLIKTAQTWQSEPLELDAGMDLESLRNQLSKTLPMDNCCFLDSCTAERFFRIDRAQEQLHYVADVVSEAIYILQEGPAGSSSSQAANNSSSQQQSQQSHGDNANMSREERRKMPSGERKSRGSDTNRHQSDNNNYEGGGGSYSARSRQGSNQAGGGSRGSLTADQQREERRRPGASEGGAYYDGPSKLSSNKSHHSQSSHHFVQHTPGSAYISPRDRLFGLSSEVHTFSHELLERTSDGILKVAKSGDIVGLKDLHQRGYSLLSIDAQGQTALHLASAAGHKDIVRYLIACAPPIILNMVDNDKGQTALHKAAQQKKRSICCMLVAGGARLTVRDLAGNTPRELALAAEDHELAAYLQSQEQFQLMTEEGGYMS